MLHSANADIYSIFHTSVLGQEKISLHGLERPQCMDGDLSALPPITQCPQKPRGRKPKAKATPKEKAGPEQKAGRPSAAACGFDTIGMTDEEVAERLKQIEAYRKKTQRNTAAKRKSKTKDEHDEAKLVKKEKSKRAKKAVDPEPVEPKTKKQRRSSSSTVGTTKPKVSKKSKKKEPKRKTKKERKGKKCNTAEEGAKAARKARVSRKSSAYHKAKKAAASQGLSHEEQIKAAKQAP